MTWDCAAYGPAGKDYDALCFFAEPGERSCSAEDECRARLAAERVQLFGRINALADAGDPVGLELAGTFTDPEQLLGGAIDIGAVEPLPPVLTCPCGNTARWLNLNAGVNGTAGRCKECGQLVTRADLVVPGDQAYVVADTDEGTVRKLS